MAGVSSTRGLTATNDRNSREVSVRSGRDSYFAFDNTAAATAANSKVFEVNCSYGDVAMAGMDSSNTNGTVVFNKMVGSGNDDGTTDNSQAVLTLLMSTAATLRLHRGRYWIEVTTPGSTSVDSMILITGSDS
jgi:hypothetical protein